MDTSASIELESFENEVFSINFPMGWEMDAGEEDQRLIMLRTAQKGDDDGFLENVNLIEHTFTLDSLDLDGYVDRQENIILNNVRQGKLLSSKRAESKNGPYQRIHYASFAYDIHFEFLQHLHIVDGIGYMITYTAESEHFNEYEEEAEIILNSLRIK